MKAMQMREFGAPEVLTMVDLPAPEPGPGQVRVRVVVSGVNYFEVLMRADRYALTPALPMIPGVEVAGVVDAHGPGVNSPAIGARVAAPLFASGQGVGGYAEYVVIEADMLVVLPAQLPFDIAAACMVQGLTALHLLRQSPPANKDVLIHAAAGGAGSLLVQMARQEGARTIVAAASSGAKLAFARRLGAHHGVNYTDRGWVEQVRAATRGKGADLIYELVGGPVGRQSIGALAAGGELVFGALGRLSLEKSDLHAMFEQNQSIRGFALLPLLDRVRLRSNLALLFDKAARGDLEVTIGGRFALHDAAEAHRAMEARATTGKLVLICASG